MIKIDERCTGCLACYNVCSADAIGINHDLEGFVLPYIDMDKCVGCNRCEQVCPCIKTMTNPDTKRALCLQNFDDDVLRSSSSGGAIYSLARVILERGGVVFGCAFDAKQKQFICTDTENVPLEKLLRSKYVESYVGDSFKNVKKYLEVDRWVMFCSTPCQVAGLKNYLGKEYSKLITVDFTCGGVPSQKYLRKHIEKLAKKYKGNIKDINFRDKKYGWERYCFTVRFDNCKEYSCIAENDAYMWNFLYSKATKRKSCLNCVFQEEHCADIVVADFWKYSAFPGIVNDKRGLSLVLCQSSKAVEILNEISDCEMTDICVDSARYNFYNRISDEDKIKRILMDKEYIRIHGIEKYYKKKFGLKNILKYRFRQIMLDFKRKNNGN